MGAPSAERIGPVVKAEGPIRLDEATLRIREAAGVAHSSARTRKQTRLGARGAVQRGLCGAREARRLFGFKQAGRKIVERFRHVLDGKGVREGSLPQVRSTADRPSPVPHRNLGASSRPRRFAHPTAGDLRRINPLRSPNAPNALCSPS